MSAGTSYRVVIPTSVERQIDRLTPEVKRFIQVRIVALGQNPRPRDVVKMKGVDAYRIRVGDYRVIYTIQDAIRIVTLIRVGHRRDVYRG